MFPKVTTGTDGRFTFPPTDDTFLLVAIGEAGYADASSDEFAKSGKLVLQPWGRIEGGVRIGPRSGSNQEVAFVPIRPKGKGGFYIVLRLHDMERRAGTIPIRPGDPRPRGHGAGRRHGVPGHDHAHVLLAGACRGRARPDGRGPGRRQGPAGDRPARPGWHSRGAGRLDSERAGESYGVAKAIRARRRSALFDSPRFGSPRRSTRTAGSVSRMSLPASTRWRSALGHPGFGLAVREIAKVSITVTVPEIPGGRSNEPLDLGTITARQVK